MKALVYVKEKTLSYQIVKDPVVKEGELLIKVKSVGICG